MPTQVERLNAAFSAAWDRSANGQTFDPKGLNEEELLHARLGYLTGMLHASADVPAGFRNGWNRDSADEPLDIEEYLDDAG